MDKQTDIWQWIIIHNILFNFIFREPPHLDLEGLFKRHFTMVTFLQGLVKIYNFLEYVTIKTSFKDPL